MMFIVLALKIDTLLTFYPKISLQDKYLTL